MTDARLIRPATPGDLDRLVAMWDDFMKDQARYVRTVRRTKANRQAVRQHLESLLPHGQVLVLEAEGRVLGYSVVAVNLPRLDFHYASAAISDLYVDPVGRGKGWGKALLQATIDMITARGLHAISITVAAGNDAARALYRSLGFRPLSETLLLPLEPELVRFGAAYPEGE